MARSFAGRKPTVAGGECHNPRLGMQDLGPDDPCGGQHQNRIVAVILASQLHVARGSFVTITEAAIAVMRAATAMPIS
jgi:hypothetical protein